MTAAVSRPEACFALATPDTWADPWPMYRVLREHDPVHHVIPEDAPDHDYYVLSRHADVFAAARDCTDARHYRKAAADDGWAKCLAWFRKNGVA